MDELGDYKANLENLLDEVVKINKLSAIELRWLPDDDKKFDTVAFVCFKHNEDNLTALKELDGKWLGDENTNEGKYLAVKPNGFTNDKINSIFPRTNFKSQETAIRRFNDRNYLADRINERNATPLAIARVLVKEEDDESEDEDGEEGWAPVAGVVKAEPVSPIKVAIEPICCDCGIFVTQLILFYSG